MTIFILSGSLYLAYKNSEILRWVYHFEEEMISVACFPAVNFPVYYHSLSQLQNPHF